MQNENGNKDEVYIKWRDGLAAAVVNTVRTHFIRKKVMDEMRPYIFFMNGECYANRVKIDFPDKKALYYFLVKALVEHAQVDGSCSYKTVIDYWARQGITVKQDPKAQKKSVDNALTQLYKDRENQKIKFPMHSLDGKKLIEKKKNHLVFNNPNIVF